MSFGPGIRPVNPDGAAARLARKRLDPPNREWGVKHPDGQVTVHVTGHAFGSRLIAADELVKHNRDCDWCDGGTHVLVYRDRQPWRGAP